MRGMHKPVTQDEIETVLSLLKTKKSYRQIGEEIGRSGVTVGNIARMYDIQPKRKTPKKLTAEQIEEIYWLLAAGKLNQKEIAQRVGCSSRTVWLYNGGSKNQKQHRQVVTAIDPKVFSNPFSIALDQVRRHVGVEK